jgi:rod shape determining protein RodA
MKTSVWRYFDWSLLLLALILGGVGVLMVASALAGNKVLADYPLRQAGFLLVGLLLMLVTAAIDYRLLPSVTAPVYGLLLAALLLIAAIGTTSGGAQRWFTLGEFFLQPSELIKIGVILVLAQYLSANEARMGSLLTPIGAILILLPAVVLIYLQPNLGTAVVVLVIGAVMLLVAGLRWYQMAFLAGGVAAAALPAWQYLLKDYMKDRILMFLHLEAATPSATVDSYNVDQAMISIGSGGWLGRGLFRGSQSQLHFLRVRHTDFIFSVTAEELGFAGALILLAIIAMLLFRLLRVATISRDSYGRLIVTGVATMILFQTAVNVGMNLNLLPVSGMPLPFISYGGSSLWSSLIGIGLAESVTMRHRKIDYE